MVNPWIVDPRGADATRRIDLEWTDAEGVMRPLWLQVKTELSIGEHRKMLQSVSSITQTVPRVRGEAVTPESKFEWTQYSFSRMVAYITDWSLAHDPEQANRLPAARVSYEALRRDVFDLIDEALDKHETALTTEKKVTPGKEPPVAISA